jgi:ankyrin repeat protein
VMSVGGTVLFLSQLLAFLQPKVWWRVLGTLGGAALCLLLFFGLRPDPVPPANETALLDAAAAGNLPEVQKQVQQGTPIDARRRSMPPTKWEPLQNLWTKLRFPDYPFQQGYTPLMLACIGGHRPVAEYLLQQRADANAVVSESRDNPLYFAANYGHDDLVTLLEQYGAKRPLAW